MTTRCETCRHSAPGLGLAGGAVTKCHIRAPGPDGWPTVRPSDHCGEYAEGANGKGLTDAEASQQLLNKAASDTFYAMFGKMRSRE